MKNNQTVFFVPYDRLHYSHVFMPKRFPFDRFPFEVMCTLMSIVVYFVHAIHAIVHISAKQQTMSKRFKK